MRQTHWLRAAPPAAWSGALQPDHEVGILTPSPFHSHVIISLLFTLLISKMIIITPTPWVCSEDLMDY
jgi:hypothetical protein